MNAGLGAKPSVSIVSADLDGAPLDACDVAFRLFNDFSIKALTFRKFQIHALNHARPVLGFGTAGTGLNFKEAVCGVVLLIEHPLKFEMFDLLSEFGDVRFNGFKRTVVAFFFSHLEEFKRVLKAACQLFERENNVFEMLFFFTEFLCSFLILPNVRIL